MQEGFGVLYLTNGERFEGCFANDYVHGSGKYYKMDNTSVEGIWKENIQIK